MTVQKISKEVIEKLSSVSLDVLIEKHELHSWRIFGDELPYLFEIDGKKVLIEMYLEPQEFQLTKHFTSADSQFLIVMYYNTEHESNYIAIAHWHPVAEIFVTMFCHSTYIADWEKFKNIYTVEREKKNDAS